MLDEMLDAGYGRHAAEVVQREHSRSIGTFQSTCSYLVEQLNAEACVLLSHEGTFLASDGEVSREEVEELKEGRNPSGWKRRQYLNIVACLRIAVLRKPGAVDVALAILQAQLACTRMVRAKTPAKNDGPAEL